MRYNAQGYPCRDFRDAVEICSEVEIPGFLVRGPRTAQWVLRFMAEQGTPIQRHTRFKSEANLQQADAGVAQHEQLCKLLHTAISFDQLDGCNCAVVELICREIQMIEDKYSERLLAGSEISPETAHLFLGTHSSRGNVCMSPALRDWVATELRDEAAILKERRKAREERQLNRPPANHADGGKKGKKGGGQ